MISSCMRSQKFYEALVSIALQTRKGFIYLRLLQTELKTIYQIFYLRVETQNRVSLCKIFICTSN